MTDETPEIHITIHTPIDLSDQNELAKKLAPVLVMHLERYKAKVAATIPPPDPPPPPPPDRFDPWGEPLPRWAIILAAWGVLGLAIALTVVTIAT